MDRCEQCGFVYESLAPGDIGSTIRSLAQDIGAELVNPAATHHLRDVRMVLSGVGG